MSSIQSVPKLELCNPVRFEPSLAIREPSPAQDAGYRVHQGELGSRQAGKFWWTCPRESHLEVSALTFATAHEAWLNSMQDLEHASAVGTAAYAYRGEKTSLRLL